MMMLSGLLAVEVESLTKSAVVADRSAKVAVFVRVSHIWVIFPNHSASGRDLCASH